MNYENHRRYKKKVEKDEDYIRQVKNLGDAVEQSIMQNYAIDIYQQHPSVASSQEYFSGEYADHSSEPPSAKTLSVFKDPNEIKRTVSHISWYPDGGRKLAVAFSIMQFQDWRMDKMSQKSYIWDVNNPNTPDFELVPSSALCCLEYNPKDPHILLGGSYNGLISMFDTRKGPTPAEISIIEKSHRDPVYDIAWLTGKTAYECASTSTDGQVLWWDIRRPEPSDSLALEDKSPGCEGRTMGGVSMEYSAAAGPTKFLVGTEQGKVVSCNRKAKNPSDRIGTIYEGHCGPVYALQRNTFFPKYFLTIGDWTVSHEHRCILHQAASAYCISSFTLQVRLWNEEIRHPIMTSKYFKNYVLDATWQEALRVAHPLSLVIAIICTAWQVDDDGLFSVKMQEAGNMLATGSVDGSVYMLELCEGLAAPQSNEKQSVNQMLERESKREKNLEARQKELRQKEKRQTEMAAADPVDKVPWEEQVKQIEEKFWESIQQAESKAEAEGAAI
ncbi:MAG: hypothetical protein SGPRY_000072 [Prymnesium sp.]